MIFYVSTRRTNIFGVCYPLVVLFMISWSLLSDLARIVAFADERIPFMALSAELAKQNVIIGDVEIVEKAVGLVLKVVKFPRLRFPRYTHYCHFIKFAS